ncbi:flagellar biosynthetic protein FliO [Kamptonema cortianum]|nr:flagellar biosynthetic protein FliO [Geitlerinema splendidum]MDK3158730.1 flagellar biosynthetic protein FliO [Kamptonema cortianum]
MSIASLALVICSAAFGQAGDFGTKVSTSSGTSATTASPAMPILQILVVAGILVFLLKVAVPKLIGRAGKQLGTGLNSPIKIEESASFGAGNLYVVSVRGKTLLLGVAGTGVTCLADLTDQSETTQPEEPAFFEMVDQASEAIADHAVVETPVDQPVQPRKPHAKLDAYRQQEEVELDPEPRDLQERLERLRKLVG